MNVNGKHYRTVWMEGTRVCMIDQNKLPFTFEIFSAQNHRETADAIRTMTVRGAGALGVAAAYGMAQAFLETRDPRNWEAARRTLEATRPTAQNLFYAIGRVYQKGTDSGPEAAVSEAVAISDEDASFSKAIGEHGAALIRDGMRLLTHCNAGWLAFADFGTVTAPMYRAQEQGKNLFVWVSETRPRAQGARLTAWELSNARVPYKIVADNAAALLMRRGEVDMVLVGCDRVAANGDVANKIGTLDRAILAKEFKLPFYVAAPLSTIDFTCPTGENIPIEERSPDEILYQTGLTREGKMEQVRVAAPDATAYNPAFDVTPARYITGLITPMGILPPHDVARLRDRIPRGP